MRTIKGFKVKVKQLYFCLFASMMILTPMVLTIGTGQAQAASGLPYDDFHLSTIDRTKWQRQEAERGIKSGAVESSFTQYGLARSFWLEFNDPNAKNSIQTDITVTEISNDGATLMARIGGHFYNSIYSELNPGNGEQGEIWVQIGVRDSGAGLFGYYSIGRCEDALCNEFTTLIWNDSDFGPVNLGETHTFSVVWNWDGSDPATNTFTFSFDGTPVPPIDPLTPVMGPSKGLFKGIGVRVDGIDSPDEGGTITSLIDSVWVNGASYDDFSAPDGRIDRTKWRSGEFVRQVNNGVLESAVARWNRNGSNHLNFLDVNAITAFRADVTVKEVINNGASPRARVSGAFYNDGTPGEGSTGNILAGAIIVDYGAELEAHCWVSRCIQPDCNIPGEYENLWWDYLTTDPILLDETHTLSLAWDVEKNKFTFGFDDTSITTDVILPDVVTPPQGYPFNGIGTRVHGIGDVGVPPFPGEGGYIRATFDNVVLLTDFAPPYTSGHAPEPGASAVAVDTDIVVHVRDDGTGVDQSTLIMSVDGSTVYDGSNPGTYPDTVISGDVADYTLTYDPTTDFDNEQQVEVQVEASDLSGNTMAPQTYVFLTEAPAGNPWEPPPEDSDDDGDGIPNTVETGLLGTNPTLKTLFVRPKHEIGFLTYEYWDEFIALFPWAGRPGFADMAPFKNTGIEVSVIGDPGNPYAPMRDFAYDPATDANQPPCDILEIVIKRDTSYCSYNEANEGHTFFTGTTWSWDTKGYTPNNPTSNHYQKYHYHTPIIYPLPLNNYFSEGVYTSIQVGQPPMSGGSGCGYDQCWDFVDHASTLNVNQVDSVNGLPDDTVEFNQIIFSPTGTINWMGTMGIGYDRDAVERRTIIHEMGHGLLGALSSDHCVDPNCIMFQSVADWDLHAFGPGSCEHRPGGSKDIRAAGVIHNSVH